MSFAVPGWTGTPEQLEMQKEIDESFGRIKYCISKEVRDALENSERYKGFHILPEPMEFNKLFRDKDFDCVQLHSLQEVKGAEGNIFGFCGVFEWKDNTLKSLDYDTYYEDTLVYGYSEFSTKDTKKGLDILT